MKRLAFKVELKEGYFIEYKKRHDETWPELSILLSNAGIVNYSVNVDWETNILFAFQKPIESGEATGSQNLGSTEIIQKWWKYLADLIETNSDYSPVSVPLVEVFYLK